MKKLLTVPAALLIPAMAFASSEGGHHGYVMNWWDFMWRVITFCVFAFILIKILRKPIMNGLTDRTKQIEKAISDAVKAQEHAKIELTNYELKMKEMDKDLELMKERAEKIAAAEKAMILEDAERSMEKLKAFAESMIATELTKAKVTLKKEAVRAAMEIVESRLATDLTGARQKELVQQYMKRIGAQN